MNVLPAGSMAPRRARPQPLLVNTPALHPRPRHLPAGAVLGFRIERHARVICIAGELWVTGPDTGDRILQAGECLTITGHGRIVTEALRASRFVVTE
jgi:hypothetical protein